MRRASVTIIAVIAVALSTSACATIGRDNATLLSPTFTIVAGVSMLEPEQAPAVTYDAVVIQPDHAALIAAFAVAAAPDQAASIVSAARRAAPERAAEVETATKRVLRRRSTPVFAAIPDHGALVRLVERVTIAR